MTFSGSFRYSFQLTDEQIKQYCQWQQKHDKICPFYDDGTQAISPAGGGAITFEFTPNSIGEIQVVRCACGEKLDLTKYGDW